MVYRIYEWLLKRELRILPETICVMIGEEDLKSAPEKMFECTGWAGEISGDLAEKNRSDRARPGTGSESPVIKSLTFHVSTKDPEDLARYLPVIRKIGTIARLTVHCAGHEEKLGNGMDVTVAIGLSGRGEITEAIRRMARDRVNPDSVTEEMIDSCLTFRYAPDIVIKTGGDHLTDFLIWQSVYSELYFSDVNWKLFRKVDFLRVLRDYQSRARRFGK